MTIVKPSAFYKFYKNLNSVEKDNIIREATLSFAKFLDSLKIDWRNDPETLDTPTRVAQMYVNDLLQGRFTDKPPITQGELTKINNPSLKIFGPIQIKSICTHHCMPFSGFSIIGISGSGNSNNLLGIGRYTAICNWYAKRGQLQERLGDNILQELETVHSSEGVAIFIKAQHTCFSHKGSNDSCSKLYTIHSNDKFKKYHDSFLSTCMQM